MALINEYRPGAPIGWHRDAPQYDIVGGISLLSTCRMKFRPQIRPGTHAPGVGGKRMATHAITLVPRSALFMTGEARNGTAPHSRRDHTPLFDYLPIRAVRSGKSVNDLERRLCRAGNHLPVRSKPRSVTWAVRYARHRSRRPCSPCACTSPSEASVSHRADDRQRSVCPYLE